MNRFFVDKSKIQNDMAVVEGEDASHIHKVLRLRPGDALELCDGQGTDYLGEIQEIDKSRIKVLIQRSSPSRGEPEVKVTLYQGIPKGSKMDVIIQKCVELGVHEIVPVVTARTVVKLETQKDEEKKVARWQKIAEEAAKQSKRGTIPIISMPVSYDEAVRSAKQSIRIIPWEEERGLSLRMALGQNEMTVDTAAILIGPEGGLEERETTAALEQGWKSVTLGPRILRTETAGMAVLAAIMFYMEEMEWK